MKNSTIKLIIWAVLFFCLLSGGLSYFFAPKEGMWFSLLLSLSVALLQLFLGIVIVNYYLESKESQYLNQATLNLIADNVTIFSNHLNGILTLKFGEKRYNEFISEYNRCDRNADKLAYSDIKDYIEAISSDFDSLKEQMGACVQQLLMISSTGAFNHIPDCLAFSTTSIRIFNNVKNLNIDNNQQNHRIIFSNLEDFDFLIVNLCKFLI